MSDVGGNEKVLWDGNCFSRFFIWCSGARIYILKQCPTEINVYLGIGIIVFLTGVLASVSGGYAVWMVFEKGWISITFGLFWGVLIFFLDWYLVASLRKEKKIWKEISMALPRVVLSLFIAVVVARPIEMRLFEQEIEARMATGQIEKRMEADSLLMLQFSEIEQLKSKNDSIQARIDETSARRDQLFAMYIAEAEGTGGTGYVGKGPVFREKKAEYDKSQQEFDDAKRRFIPLIEQNLERVRFLQKERDQLLTSNQIIITRSKGFLSRYRSLDALMAEDAAVNGVALFILLLFAIIEVSPIFVKLISNRGPYDDLLALEQLRISAEAKKAYTSIRNQLLRELDLEHEMVQAEMSIHQESSKESVEQLASAQREINSLRILKWKEYQLSLNGDNTMGDRPVLIDFIKKPEPERVKEVDENGDRKKER
ncbi:MAG: DUF4407 domain-containing protein [Salinivirgaceae bacterium]|nr:DUF4407 domain-containing protein [Salinivirgaceae bacterium]MDD4746814.1 DUF4407 domain-containing protein [Salinivirgaceae bacterium]MDY0278982.1 DUF4407 domain-containing protein [Salinivirgaceae bacterium]